MTTSDETKIVRYLETELPDLEPKLGIARDILAALDGRPVKGSPEWDLWVASIEIATYPPLRAGTSVFAAQVPWSRIEELRTALDAGRDRLAYREGTTVVTTIPAWSTGEVVIASSVSGGREMFSAMIEVDGQLWSFSCRHLHLSAAIAERCYRKTVEGWNELSGREWSAVQTVPYPIIEFRWTRVVERIDGTTSRLGKTTWKVTQRISPEDRWTVCRRWDPESMKWKTSTTTNEERRKS